MANTLPEKYEALNDQKFYWKPSKMEEGENRFRILGRPIAGWLDWKDKKPYRFRPDKKPVKPFVPGVPVKKMWAMHVWDYAREGLYILEIEQSSLLKALVAIHENPKWGDYTQYDLKITKQGTGKDSRYILTPLPHTPLDVLILQALKAAPVRLEALYEGGNPWTDLTQPEEVDTSTGELQKASNGVSEEQAAELDTYFTDEPNLKEKVEKQFKIKSVYHLGARDCDGLLKTLRARKTQKMAGTHV